MKFRLSITIIAGMLLIWKNVVAGQADTSAQFYHLPKSEFCLSVSYCIPVGVFGDPYHLDESVGLESSLTKTIEGTSTYGFNALPGYEAEACSYFYFNKNNVQTVGGLKLTYLSFTSIPFNWYKSGDYIFNFAHYKRLNFISLGIGPVMRIALGKVNCLRLYYQVRFSVGWNGAWSNSGNFTEYDGNDMYVIRDNSEFKLNSGTGLKNKFGVSLNIKKYLLDVGYDFGSISYSDVQFSRHLAYDVYSFDTFSGSYHYMESGTLKANETLSADAPTSFLTLSLGYMF